MKNILIINGAKEFAHSSGKLNDSLVQLANDFFLKNNFNVKITNVDKGYDITEEIEKFLWADCVIYQFPVWWMGYPW
ncbi:MAG: NAD(P)H-dependent oxidoreductase, partial [Alphaproteobacteria bacterium]|nr:NAD(P)H-dependent oxidoreductase [Alphaproteobacteria bacterium]